MFSATAAALLSGPLENEGLHLLEVERQAPDLIVLIFLRTSMTFFRSSRRTSQFGVLNLPPVPAASVSKIKYEPPQSATFLF